MDQRISRYYSDLTTFSRRNHRGHFSAGDAYSRGLLRRSMRHQLYRARRPDADTGGEPGP